MKDAESSSSSDSDSDSDSSDEELDEQKGGVKLESAETHSKSEKPDVKIPNEGEGSTPKEVAAIAKPDAKPEAAKSGDKEKKKRRRPRRNGEDNKKEGEQTKKEE